MISFEDSRYLKSYFLVSGLKNAACFWVNYCHLDLDFTNFSGSFYYEMSGILWNFLLPGG
jgi:hypothetical protein